MKTIFLTLMVLVFVTGCAPTTQTRGNFIEAEDIALIQPAVSTESDVLNILGTPTSKAVFNESVWYYVGLKTAKESFFDEQVTDRQIIRVAFDDQGLVQGLDRVEDEALDVPIASRVTPTSGNEVTFIQQILGNIGKFNKQPPAQGQQ